MSTIRFSGGPSAGLVGLALLLVTAALSGQAVASETMTLSDLRDMCGSTSADRQAACRFFILGAFQGLSLAGSAQPGAGGLFIERQTGKAFCVPNSLEQDTMVQRVVSLANADLKAFPEDAKMPAISFVGSVVAKSYPCR